VKSKAQLEAERLLSNSSTSEWLKNALRSARFQDIPATLSDLEILADILHKMHLEGLKRPPL
jgi:hypothetical protein